MILQMKQQEAMAMEMEKAREEKLKRNERLRLVIVYSLKLFFIGQSEKSRRTTKKG